MKRRTAPTWLHVSCALEFTVVYLGCVMSLTGLCAGAFHFSCVRGNALLRTKQEGVSKVGKFTVKHRNPLLRDFHTVPRLRVRSQPPTASVHVCMQYVCVFPGAPASITKQLLLQPAH